jgi:hypothetical protein
VNEAEPNVALGKVRGDAPTNADAAHYYILVQKHILLSGEDLLCSPIDLFYTVYLPITY